MVAERLRVLRPQHPLPYRQRLLVLRHWRCACLTNRSSAQMLRDDRLEKSCMQLQYRPGDNHTASGQPFAPTRNTDPHARHLAGELMSSV
jgi:hypothetical protein